MRCALTSGALALSFLSAQVSASGIPIKLEEVTITAQHLDARALIGQSDSATEGLVLREQLEQRPVSRAAELLEFVPGMIATQHSGEGKANQYFLRGFNLDHGTDFAMSVDGVPVNMRTHGHGQGYADLNFLIPELVENLEYRKGPYYADVGDFSAAGSADFHYLDRLPGPLAEFSAGEFGFRRALVVGSVDTGPGHTLLAADYSEYDGPFAVDQDTGKFNGVVKYSSGNALDGMSLTAMVYDDQWNSPDQIPLRAVEQGRIDRFGFIDPTVGGESHRYSLSADLRRSMSNGGHWSLSAYALDYEMDLFSNFTYFLENDEDGDQFQQVDDRTVYGGSGHVHIPLSGDGSTAIRTGFDIRRDDIDKVGLFQSRNRLPLSAIRDDTVEETSVGVYAEIRHTWSSWLRTVAGIRTDYYDADVNALLAENSGSADETLTAPKFTAVLGPWSETEFFVNVGRGFHSNDVRGATIRIDPADGVTPVDPVDLLVPAFGYDIGMRTAIVPNSQIALSLWALDLDSELVFVGDGGATEPSGETQRYGAEISWIYRPNESLIVDADYAYSHGRFTGSPTEDRIPNAVSRVASVGVSYTGSGKLTGGLRARYFGSAPLVEDNRARSDATFVLNGEISYQFTPAIRGSLAGFNLLDSTDNDITYFYESRLPGESSGVEDIHFHPVEPRLFRATLTLSF